MTKVLALSALLATILLAQEQPPVPAFPAAADAITADVVVLDKDGRPVRGLAKEDFTLLEDGRVQTLVGFEARELTAPNPEAIPRIAVAEGRVATNTGGSSRRGRTFAFLVDDLGTEVLPTEEAKKVIASWLNEKADPRDEVTLATTSSSIWWSDRIDRGRSDLLAVLGRIQGKKPKQPRAEWMSDWEAYRITVYEDVTGASADASPSIPNRLGSTLDRVANRWRENHVCTSGCPTTVRARAMELYGAMTRRVQATLHAVERLSQGLAGVRGRKSIVVLSEGFLNDSHQTGFDRAIESSRRGNTAVYFIDLKGLAGLFFYGADQPTEARPNPADVSLMSMEEGFLETAGTEMVAEATGGTSVRNTNDLLGGLERVANESSTYYLLGYQPEKSPDGKWHKLEVKVSRRGLKVRARRGYQATPPPWLEPRQLGSKTQTGDRKTKDSSKGPKRPLDPAVMTSGADETIALRVAPYVLEADKAALARVLVALEVDTSTIALQGVGERRKAALDLTILGVSRDESRTFPIDERVQLDMEGNAVGGWLTLSREVHLPAGVAQVRVLVRDVATGRAGTVTQRLVVPPLDQPYLATPILSDRVATRPDGSLRVVPVAHRRFRPQGRLFCVYEVFGMKDAEGKATTRVAGGYTLKTAGGRVVNAAPPTPIAMALGGRAVRMILLPVAGAEEGDYELTLDVVDHATGRALTAHEPFTLEKEPSAGAE
jgi:VWFA-related protein